MINAQMIKPVEPFTKVLYLIQKHKVNTEKSREFKGMELKFADALN